MNAFAMTAPGHLAPGKASRFHPTSHPADLVSQGSGAIQRRKSKRSSIG